MVRPRKFTGSRYSGQAGLNDPSSGHRYLRSMYRGRTLVASPRLRWALLAFLFGLYLFNFLGGDHGFFRKLGLQRELEDLQAENAKLRLAKERMVNEVQLKENDPLSLERLAREKYWMIGPDEKVYRFPDDEVVPDVEVPGVKEEPAEDEAASEKAGSGG